MKKNKTPLIWLAVAAVMIIGGTAVIAGQADNPTVVADDIGDTNNSLPPSAGGSGGSGGGSGAAGSGGSGGSGGGVSGGGGSGGGGSGGGGSGGSGSGGSGGS